MQSRHSRTGPSGQVRELPIRHCGVSDQAHIAADLDISVRARRRPAGEGTPFREIAIVQQIESRRQGICPPDSMTAPSNFWDDFLVSDFEQDDATAPEESTRLRSIASIALLVDFAKTRGLSTASVLRDSTIRSDQLQDPSQEITLAQEIAVMRNIVAALDDEPSVGLMSGLLCHATNLGVLGLAILSSRTLYEATTVGMRYVDLSFAIARHTFEEHGDELRQVRDDRAVPADLRRFATERDFAAAITLQQDMPLTPVPILRMEITLDEHPAYRMFAAMLDIDELVFGAERTMTVWRAGTLDMKMPQANPTLARYYQRQCEELMRRRRSRTGLSGQVRTMLLRRGGMADQHRIAADLGVGVRTLRRRLANEGITFRELTAETMGLLAEELLLTGLTVEQAAERLGYSSVSAFATAFRGWKGQSPGTFARTNRGRVSTGA
jgi:AraC-like DNA-binding protein